VYKRQISEGAGQTQVRLIRMDPETGAGLGSETLSPLVDERRPLFLHDDGAGGVILGATKVVDATNSDALIFRVDSTLTLDASFGIRQIAFDLDPAGLDVLQGLEVLSDGRIIALMEVPTTLGPEAGLIFLNADGTLDDTIVNGSFPDGLQIVPFLIEGEIYPVAMDVDSQDRIWIAAARFGPSVEKVAVARVLANGVADTSYAGNGSSLLDFRECVLCPSQNADPRTSGFSVTAPICSFPPTNPPPAPGWWRRPA